MILLYLDESGDSNDWQHYNHFVLGGFAIHEGQIRKFSEKLDRIQAKYFPNFTVPIIFHASEIRNGKGRFGHFNRNKRDRLLSELYHVIGNARYPNLVAFATAMHISAVANSTQALRETLEDISIRFNTYLVRRFKRGAKHKGLVIIDQHREERYREHMSEFRELGTKLGYIGNIVDIPYFAKSRHTRMIQLADLVAYAVFRYYEKNNDLYIKMILDSFDKRSQTHPPDGLKHITSLSYSCQCLDCSWRRALVSRLIRILIDFISF